MLKASVLNSADIECTYMTYNIYVIEVPEAREDEVMSKTDNGSKVFKSDEGCYSKNSGNPYNLKWE